MRSFITVPESVGEQSITLTGPDVHHIKNVLRMKPGDEIFVSAGNAGRFRCVISEMTETDILTTIAERLPGAKTPAIKLTLAQAIPKGRKMDDVIRMACELGVGEIVPVITERCVTKLGDDTAENKTERWNAIAHAAAKQSRAPSPTLVLKPVNISSLAETVKADLSIVMWENEKKTLKNVLTDHPSPKSVLVLIGPEGGFAKSEVCKLQEHGFEPASFGAKILRTQTAGAAVVSAILFHYND